MQQHDVLQLISLECALLDDRDYLNWLDLFAEGAVYWLPVDRRAIEPNAQLNLVYETRTKLKVRVDRLLGDKIHAEQPPSEVARMVSGTRVIEMDEQSCVARSAYLAVVNRLGTTRLIGGHVTHRIARIGGELKILERRLDLLGAAGPLEDLTFLP